jgi:hypothetical protein
MAAAAPAALSDLGSPAKLVRANSELQALLKGGVAGCVAKTATAPLTRLTVLAQTCTLLTLSSEGRLKIGLAANRSVHRALRDLAESEGLHALWRGNACTLVHRFPFAGVNFMVFESCRKILEQRHARYRYGDTTYRLFSFLPGAVAGFASVVLCYPLEVLRTRLMVDMQFRGGARDPPRTALDHFNRMRAEASRDGLRTWYKGVGLAWGVTVPAVSISFAVYTNLQQYFESWGYGRNCCASTLLAGGASGVVASTFTYPLDTLRRRSQAGTGAAVSDLARDIWRVEGAEGFMKGIRPEILKAFPTVAITYLTYELLR